MGGPDVITRIIIRREEERRESATLLGLKTEEGTTSQGI